MRLYLVTYKTEQADDRVDRAYLSIEEAKVRAAELEASITHYVNSHVGIVATDLVRPTEWTEEQRRWFRGAP